MKQFLILCLSKMAIDGFALKTSANVYICHSYSEYKIFELFYWLITTVCVYMRESAFALTAYCFFSSIWQALTSTNN